MKAGQLDFIPEEIRNSKTYYFYQTLTYGYCVLNSNGMMDIYNIYDMYFTDNEVDFDNVKVLSDCSFFETEAKVEETKITRYDGSENDIAFF